MSIRLILIILFSFYASLGFSIELNSLGLVKVRQAFLFKSKNIDLSKINLSLDEVNDPQLWPKGRELEIATWLLGKVDSQVIYGEKIEVINEIGEWIKVRVKDHWTKNYVRGYEGPRSADLNF